MAKPMKRDFQRTEELIAGKAFRGKDRSLEQIEEMSREPEKVPREVKGGVQSCVLPGYEEYFN